MPHEPVKRGKVLVTAFLSNNAMSQTGVPALIQTVFDKLQALAGEPAPAELTPAVSVRRSVTDDYLVCLEDGKRLKTLKRHLTSAHGMTPEQYRSKWGLRPDYPMVALSYSRQCQGIAKAIGLGRTRTPLPPPPKPKRGLRKVA